MAKSSRFANRFDGMNKAKRIWACQNCRVAVYVKPNGRPCDICGCTAYHYFASKIEHKRFCELCLLLDYKQIRDLEVQVPFPVDINGELITTYKADAVYIDCKTGKKIIEDVKPKFYRDELYKLKKKMVEAHYLITITEV